MTTVQTRLTAPDPLVPALLHTGAQRFRLEVENRGTVSTGPLEVKLLLADLAVDSVVVSVAPVAAGQTHAVEGISLPLERLRLNLLANHQYRDDALPCRLQASLAGEPCGECAVGVLPVNAWDYQQHPEALAAFVNKESGTVGDILQRSRPYLRERLGVTSFAEALDLSSHPPATCKEQIVRAVYHCLLESYGIHWEREIRSTSPGWQKIRFHERVFAAPPGAGTCIDLALLMAACLESAHLDPLVIVVETGPYLQHALVGCWMETPKDRTAVISDYDLLTRAVAAGKLLVWDPTGFTSGEGAPFSAARATGEQCLTAAGANGFVFAVDMARTRWPEGARKAISPLPFGSDMIFSEAGWRVIRRAEELAREQRFDQIESAHLALSVLTSEPGLAQEAFGRHADRLQVRIAERLLRKIQRVPLRETNYLERTRSFQSAMERSGALARLQEAVLAGPIQLLQAILETPGATLAKSLAELELELDPVRARLAARVLRDPRRSSYAESSLPDGER